MRLLLLRDVPKLGYLGDVVEVKPGYARNYLLPQGLATEPTEENIRAIQEAKKRAAAERAARLKQYRELAEQLREVQVTIEAQANPEGTLYGSVGPRDIAEALKEMGYPVKPEQIRLDAPIRTLDNRTVDVHFAEDIEAQVKVWVVRAGEVAGEGSPEQPAAAEGASHDESETA